MSSFSEIYMVKTYPSIAQASIENIFGNVLHVIHILNRNLCDKGFHLK